MTVLTPVFISYDKRDRFFVNLLHRLLEHERIESWIDREQINAGERYQERLLTGLKDARSLIVVVSKHSLDSAWVRAELNTFRMLFKDASIIPVLLDEVLPASVDPALEAYQHIDMREDMLQGFTNLCARYGRGFLSGHGQRRTQANRRVTPDRRQVLLRRLRTGLWQHYAHTTGLGKFDIVDVNLHSSAKLASALQVELSKYELYDENKRQIDSKWALDHALAALAATQPRAGEAKAIYLIERLASYLYENYEVRNRDRRRKVERRASKEPLRKTG